MAAGGGHDGGDVAFEHVGVDLGGGEDHFFEAAVRVRPFRPQGGEGRGGTSIAARLSEQAKSSMSQIVPTPSRTPRMGFTSGK